MPAARPRFTSLPGRLIESPLTEQPVPPSPSRQSTEFQEAASPPDAPETEISVLIVDDEELLVKSCSEILSTEGYTVFSERRGKTALAAFHHHRPDIVVTDLMLPDMDGLTLLKK